MGAEELQTEPGDPPDPGPLTLLLNQAAEGTPGAWEHLLGAVYEQLRALAQVKLRGERLGHTLQPTALVSEVYLRLLRLEQITWRGRAHFFRAAAEAMRRILIDHARARQADKRSGGRSALEIAGVSGALSGEDSAGLIALDEAMDRLALGHPSAAEVVRLRFYAGLDYSASAQVLGISERSVRREWAFARGWLRDRLERDERGEA
jgi:RNA polymerase sigma-70 factor, ECF subfamily